MSIIWYCLVFFLGMSVGSYLHVAVVRRRTGISAVYGRSCCPACRGQLAWYDTVPVLSYLLLRGRCRSCAVKIPPQYPLLELVVGCLFLLPALLYTPIPSWPFLLRDWGSIAILLFTALYDWRYQEIPVFLLGGASGILLALSIWLGWQQWENVLLGLLLGGGFLGLQWLVSQGRAMGGGDWLMGVFMGVVLGFPLVVVGLFLGYVLGALVSVLLRLREKKNISGPVPLGSYLSAGTILTIFWGDSLLAWFLALL